MQPESKWNSPYVAIEETRKENQFKKFVHLSGLWNASTPAEIETLQNWDSLYSFQSETLINAISKEKSSSFFNQLESSCWQYGKSLAEKDWPVANIRHPHDGYLALKTLRIGSLKNAEPFILERKTQNACTFYWMSSPSEHHELCMLYHEIFRGYFYHLSRNLRVEITPSILPSSEEKLKTWKISLLWIE